MHYDPNYRNQFFHESPDSIGIREAIDLTRREVAVSQYKTKMPKSKLSKITLFAFLGSCALVLIVTAIVWFISKSLLFTLVLFVIMAFLSVGIIAVITVIGESVLRKNCTEPVEATCIGYSVSGGGSDHSTAGNRVERAPVFEYEYQGLKWVAFDGVYDNFSKVPFVSQKTTIMINPDDPEDIVWNFGKHRQFFLILAFLFGTVLGVSMLLVVLNDDNFMNSAFSDDTPRTETESTLNSGSEIPSGDEVYVIKKTGDGRIILDNSYLKNEVFTAYPDSEYVIKTRKISETEVIDDGVAYAVFFEPDPDFTESEWYFTKEEVTDEVKNASRGDEFIFAEVKESGACWVFSTNEYALEDEVENE